MTISETSTQPNSIAGKTPLSAPAPNVWLSRLPDVIVPIALVAACLVFFRHVLWGDYFFPWDFVGYMYPVRRLVDDAIRQGDFPLWTPTVLGGYPLVGDPQASLFYPPFLLVHL